MLNTIITTSIISVLILLVVNIFYIYTKKAFDYINSSINLLKDQINNKEKKASIIQTTEEWLQTSIDLYDDLGITDRYIPILLSTRDIPDTPEYQQSTYLITIFDTISRTAYTYDHFEKYEEANACLHTIQNNEFKYLLAGFFLNIKTKYEYQKMRDKKNIAA